MKDAFMHPGVDCVDHPQGHDESRYGHVAEESEHRSLAVAALRMRVWCPPTVDLLLHLQVKAEFTFHC